MTKLTTKEIISKAKDYLVDTFKISKDDIYLEELTYLPEKQEWAVTFGYYESKSSSPLANNQLPPILNGYAKRYKIVTVDQSGNFKSIKKHEID